MLVEILAQAVLKESVLNGVGNLCNAYALAEIAYGRGGVSAAAQAAEGGHTRIVPAGYAAFLDKPSQLALAQNGVVYTKSRKFYLAGLGGHGDIVYDPVVQRTVILVFE